MHDSSKKKKRGIQDLPEDGVCGMGLQKAKVAGFPAMF